MAQNGISINILADVREAVRGAGDVADAVENVSEVLHDLTKEGGTSTDRMEQDFKDLSRTADRESDEIRQKFRQAYKDVKKSSDDVSDGSKRNFGRASEASKEFRDEAVSNASEIASSFDGSIGSIGELAQGTLGGLASSTIPGIGVAAGLAAAGIGVITEAWTTATEATEEAKASAYEYGLTVAASGEYASATDRINELTGSIEGLKKIQDLSTASGLTQKEVLNALATGDGLPELTEAFEANALSTNIAMGRLNELEGVINGTREGFALSTDAAKLNDSALYDLATRVGIATGEFNELGQQIYKMPDGKEIVVNAKTQRAHEALNAIDDQKLPPKTLSVNTKLNTSAVDNWDPNDKTLNVRVKLLAGKYGGGRQPT